MIHYNALRLQNPYYGGRHDFLWSFFRICRNILVEIPFQPFLEMAVLFFWCWHGIDFSNTNSNHLLTHPALFNPPPNLLHRPFEPCPRWNHRSSAYLSNTLALNIPKPSPIVCISATFGNIAGVYELTDSTYSFSWATLLPSHLFKLKSLEETLAHQNRRPHKKQIRRFGLCAWRVRVFSMVQSVPRAGHCPKIYPASTQEALMHASAAYWGLCNVGLRLKALTMLGISFFICPGVYSKSCFRPWYFSLGSTFRLVLKNTLYCSAVAEPILDTTKVRR